MLSSDRVTIVTRSRYTPTRPPGISAECSSIKIKYVKKTIHAVIFEISPME